MNKLNLLSVLVVIIIFFSGCKKDNPPAPDPDPIKTKFVVINELMASNSNTVNDQNGEFDDWIELFNNADTAVNLSGYYLSDSKTTPSKWKFPEGTTILPDSSLIVWADNDTLQSGLHANYKLSSLGETVIFLTPELQLIDIAKYGEQPLIIGAPIVDQSFARIPNGTGEFVWTNPTFNNKNF